MAVLSFFQGQIYFLGFQICSENREERSGGIQAEKGLSRKREFQTFVLMRSFTRKALFSAVGQVVGGSP